jgi:hypothetical protein
LTGMMAAQSTERTRVRRKNAAMKNNRRKQTIPFHLQKYRYRRNEWRSVYVIFVVFTSVFELHCL